MKLKGIIVTKVLVFCMFVSMLGYWSFLSINRFIDQPTATFLSYTQGDDNVHVRYPLITFCGNYDLAEDQVLKDCKGTKNSLRNALIRCMKNNSDFDVKAYMNSLRLDVEDFIKEVKLEKANNEVELRVIPKEDYKNIFQSFFSVTKGLFGVKCITFNPGYLNMTVDNWTPIKLTIQKSALGPLLKRARFHSTHDFLDASKFHPWFPLNSDASGWDLSLNKRFVSWEQTKKKPCGQQPRLTCIDIKVNQMIADTYQCKLGYVYQRGPTYHLEKHVTGYTDLPICKRSVVKQILRSNITWETNDKCKIGSPCDRVKFSTFAYKHKNPSTFRVRFSDVEVEHYTTYISYTLPSLIGELGGYMGMFLGFSGVTLAFGMAEWIGQRLRRGLVCPKWKLVCCNSDSVQVDHEE